MPSVLTADGFAKLLDRLDTDRERAGEQYETLRRRFHVPTADVCAQDELGGRGIVVSLDRAANGRPRRDAGDDAQTGREGDIVQRAKIRRVRHRDGQAVVDAPDWEQVVLSRRQRRNEPDDRGIGGDCGRDGWSRLKR